MIRRIIHAYREAAIQARYDFTSADDSWTQEDAEWLNGVMESNKGRKLKARLINFRARCAIEACRQSTAIERHAGIAQGVAITIGEIEASFASPARSKGNIEENAPSSVAELLGFS